MKNQLLKLGRVICGQFSTLKIAKKCQKRPFWLVDILGSIQSLEVRNLSELSHTCQIDAVLFIELANVAILRFVTKI